MTPLKLGLTALTITALLAVVAACGDDDGGGGGGADGDGQLTDPRSVPTATPWAEAPDPIILDPDNLTPVSGGVGIGVPGGDGGDDGDAGDGGDDGDGGDNGDGGDDEPTGPPPGECGNDTYTIASGDTVFGIADKCGLEPQAILDANPGIDPGALSIGQVINLPAADSGDGEE